jgi:hypothetical protein
VSDGNIVAAKTRLKRSVGDLIDPRPAIYHDRTLWQPGLYQALVSELAGRQGDTRMPAKSLPPLWVDAVDLRTQIDRQVREWVRDPGTTPMKLGTLLLRGWRPQDTDQVSLMAKVIKSWAAQITQLLAPEDRKQLDCFACPACGKRWTYGRDSGGELVRRAALTITSTGCSCGHCQAHWPPDKYMFLAKLLGLELPEGVVHVSEG